MKASTFFRSALVLPICLPLIAMLFGLDFVLAILVMALMFGGIQYLAFAPFLYFMIGKKRSSLEMQVLSMLAPLFFVPVQSVCVIAWSYYFTPDKPTLSDAIDMALIFGLYTLVVGYFYVIVTNAVFVLLQIFGKIDEPDVNG